MITSFFQNNSNSPDHVLHPLLPLPVITDSSLVRNTEITGHCLPSLSQYTCLNVTAVVGVDAELDESSADDVTQCEDRIVLQWREVSADEKSQLREQIDEIVRPLGLQTRLVVLERANSIALYFICMTLLALTSLRDLWRRGQLRDIVQSLFTFLSGVSSVHVKRLTWPVADYERCCQFLKGKSSLSVVCPDCP